jgi:hypothetical protein
VKGEAETVELDAEGEPIVSGVEAQDHGRSRGSHDGGGRSKVGGATSVFGAFSRMYNGQGKTGVLGSLRAFASGGGITAKKDTKEGKKRHENEARSLARVRALPSSIFLYIDYFCVVLSFLCFILVTSSYAGAWTES